MILLDSNILLYAKFSDFPQHGRARMWLEEQFNRPGRVGIPWQTSISFLRLSTNARLFGSPLTTSAAWEQVSEWLDHPLVWIPGPTQKHAQVLGELLERSGATANLIPDAQLAAIAVQHGLTICSADADFARFQGVDWLNPLTQ